MIAVQIDEQKVESLYMEKIEQQIKRIDAELLFWDRKELERRTCMCWSTIQKEFLYEPGFPKHKVGSKWYFPAREAQEFLLCWIKTKSFK